MSEIDFQNGFVCGMATKGLVKSSSPYEPRCWNDEGIYSYFYIDFGKPLLLFSSGMFSESIVVSDSGNLYTGSVSYVSPGVYKVDCDITSGVRGITVVNKSRSLLKYLDGTTVPTFSVIFYISGIMTYVRKAYAYDIAVPNEIDSVTIESSTALYFESVAMSDVLDIAVIGEMDSIGTETVAITYT